MVRKLMLLLVILGSFSLAQMQESIVVNTLPASTECPEATPDTVAYLNRVSGYCLLIPAGYEYYHFSPDFLRINREIGENQFISMSLIEQPATPHETIEAWRENYRLSPDVRASELLIGGFLAVMSESTIDAQPDKSAQI